MQKVIQIGTRKSRLALVQTNMVKEKIEAAFPDVRVELVPISTKGDELLDRSLTSFGGKGVFTRELEEALLDGEIDLAVHSAKDMPMVFPEGLGISAVLKRGRPEDVIVTCDGTLLRNLKPGSVVGTSSLRRELQIRKINPLVRIQMNRGNVQTRLRKLSEGQFDAIVLAAAGLERLKLLDEVEYHYEYLDPSVCLPAAGQAILAVESRKGHLSEVLQAIHDSEAAVCLYAERAYLSAIGGSCNAPAAAWSTLDGETLHMKVMFAPDGRHMKRLSGERQTGLSLCQAEELGRELADGICQGKVWLVGAGPGDPALVTEKCLTCIREADVIVYDSLATDALLNEAGPDAELCYAGKRASNHYLKQGETNALLIQKAREGKQVVRLKGGDPFIFGRGGEEAQELGKAGIAYEIVPGVSSCYGAPAYAGIPVTHREYASSFHVITGHEGSHKTENVLDYETLAREEGADCRFLVMDAENLDFPDESFDAVISRNLTWTLPHAEQAYGEWTRVLKPGGVILNFDANYGLSDFADTSSLPKEHAHHKLGNEMMQECEEIKRQLPISTYNRPAWDISVLGQMGMREFALDLDMGKRIYVEKDEFYNPTPLFMIYAKKA